MSRKQPTKPKICLNGAGCYRLFIDRRAVLSTSGDTLTVWKLDRLGRSLRHLIDRVGKVDRRGIGYRSLQEAIDTPTPGGKLVLARHRGAGSRQEAGCRQLMGRSVGLMGR